MKVRIRNDSDYAKHRDVDRLLRSLREWDAIVVRVVGKLSDTVRDEGGAFIAPIMERPDFEHLEAWRIDVLRKLAKRQRRRRRGSS